MEKHCNALHKKLVYSTTLHDTIIIAFPQLVSPFSYFHILLFDTLLLSCSYRLIHQKEQH